MFPKYNTFHLLQRGVRLLVCSCGIFASTAGAAVVDVQVGNGGALAFAPATVNVKVGDTVRWNFASNGHTVTSGSACSPDAAFDSGVVGGGGSFSFKFNSPGSFPYYCVPHCGAGMQGVVKVAAAPKSAKLPRSQVIIPAEDRFTPLGLTIRAGDKVAWINNDTDDHTVVSDDQFNKGMSKKLKGIDQVVKGTASNGGEPGIYILRFPRPGTFVYHCRYHAHVDASGQPVAPGPGENPADPTASGIQGNDGGIPDTPAENYGTPMMGVITVLPPP